MKRDFIHNLYSSFVLWFDNHLLTHGEAFTNINGPLYPMTDVNLSGYQIFGSPFKQWVYDSSVPNAVVPSGVTVNGNEVLRGISGLKLDFQNGRAIFSGSANATNVSGSYSIKDFNIYTTTKSDYELLYETAYMINPTVPQVATGVPEDKLIAPCIFLKVKSFENEEFTFGGMDNTKVFLRAVILADDEWDLNGVGNIFADANRRHFYVNSGTPLNRYQDIRNGYYNYTDIVGSGQSPSNLAYISHTAFTKLNQRAIADKFPDLYIGFVDFSVELPRMTRVAGQM
jgi:hypothetical protein